jgi:hypothetical protein
MRDKLMKIEASVFAIVASTIVIFLISAPAEATSSRSIEVHFAKIKVNEDHDPGDAEWSITAEVAGQELITLSYPGSGLNDVHDGEEIHFDASQTTVTVIVPPGGELKIIVGGVERDSGVFGDDDPLGEFERIYNANSVPPWGEKCHEEEPSDNGDYALTYQIGDPREENPACF